MASYKEHRDANTVQTRMIPCFPDEITEHILLRLPVEHLLEFKCVQKSWCALISSKRFIRAHLQNSNKDASLVFVNPTGMSTKKEILSYSLQSFIKDSSLDAIDLPKLRCIVDAKRNVCLVGCINGLCCIILDDKDYFLWNPCMGNPKRLPEIYDDGKPRCIWNLRYGFGYDQANNDYKVLMNILVVVEGGAFTNEYTYLYSLKRNSWKMTKPLEGGMARGEFLNGRLHWLKQGTDPTANILVYFDLASEIYGTVELPVLGQRAYRSLGVLDGCLSLLSVDLLNTETALWIYKQYGMKESCVKLVTIPHEGIHGPCFLHTPLCISPRGEMLLVNGLELLSYDPRSGAFMSKETSLNPKTISGSRHKGFIFACVYVKSLISPFTYDEPSEPQSQRLLFLDQQCANNGGVLAGRALCMKTSNL